MPPERVEASYFDGRTAEKHRVTVALSPPDLVVEAAGGGHLARWPLAGVSTPGKPDPDGMLTLRRTGDSAFLRLADAAFVREVTGARGARGGMGWRWAAASLLSIPLLLLLVDRGPDLIAALVPAPLENRLGATVQADVARGHAVCDQAPGMAALAILVARLGTAAGVGGPIRFVVLDSPVVNAFALPGDRIVIMRGLIGRMEDGDELAGVLAHETGHLLHRDPMRTLARSAGLQLGLTVLGLDQSPVGVGASLIDSSYSRAAEAAADASAVETLRRAGMHPDGLARALARLEAGEGESSALAGWLSDHPPTPDRRARVSVPPTGTPAMSDAEWAAVREVCRP